MALGPAWSDFPPAASLTCHFLPHSHIPHWASGCSLDVLGNSHLRAFALADPFAWNIFPQISVWLTPSPLSENPYLDILDKMLSLFALLHPFYYPVLSFHQSLCHHLKGYIFIYLLTLPHFLPLEHKYQNMICFVCCCILGNQNVPDT